MTAATLLAGLALVAALVVATMSRRCCCQDTPPGDGCARRRFVFYGCTGGAAGLTGSTIVVTRDGTTVFSGDSGGTNEVWTGLLSTGTYSWTATHPSGRFQDATGTFVVTCPTGDATIPVAFTPASGYVCVCWGPKPLPLKRTLPATLAGQSFTLTYSDPVDSHVGSVGVPWAGCVGPFPGPLDDCPAATIPMTVCLGFCGRCNSVNCCNVQILPPAVFAQPCGVRYLEYVYSWISSAVLPFESTAVVYGAVFGTCNGAPLDPAGQSTLIVTE